MRRTVCACFITLIPCLSFGQQPEPAPHFETADVHVSPKSRNAFARTSGPGRSGRYEVKMASMVDLIRIAYGFTDDRILEGPSWVEMDRFDIAAKVPPGTTPDDQKLMLQSLLKDRFHLVVKKEERPLPHYFLVEGKKPQLKPADGSGESGCKPKAATGPAPEGGMMIGINGTRIILGPGGTIEFNCRNMSMADFASGLRSMFGSSIGNNPVTDETGLKGIWNFDVHWTLGLMGMMSDAGPRITVAEAIEKQLGMKLEQRPVPTPVIVVVSADRKPTDNPPDVATKLPPAAAPAEFEVADIKPSAPGGRGGNLRMQPGGRLNAQGAAMQLLLMRAFNTTFNNEELSGIPDWAMSERYDIVAKAPAGVDGTMDQEAMAQMIRALLVDRFKMTFHKEQRPATTYALTAVKPKLKKADPNERSSCRNENAPAGAPPGTEMLVCHNVTMEQFADSLQGAAQGLNWPVADLTELAGGWDLTLTYSRFPQLMAQMAGPGRGGGDAAGVPGGASDPSGAVTIFEAVEKQLGLKLVARKKDMPMIVIDHLEQKPTDN